MPGAHLQASRRGRREGARRSVLEPNRRSRGRAHRPRTASNPRNSPNKGGNGSSRGGVRLPPEEHAPPRGEKPQANVPLDASSCDSLPEPIVKGLGRPGVGKPAVRRCPGRQALWIREPRTTRHGGRETGSQGGPLNVSSTNVRVTDTSTCRRARGARFKRAACSLFAPACTRQRNRSPIPPAAWLSPSPVVASPPRPRPVRPRTRAQCSRARRVCHEISFRGIARVLSVVMTHNSGRGPLTTPPSLPCFDRTQFVFLHPPQCLTISSWPHACPTSYTHD